VAKIRMKTQGRKKGKVKKNRLYDIPGRSTPSPKVIFTFTGA
jgi:hypothetical protein